MNIMTPKEKADELMGKYAILTITDFSNTLDGAN